MSAVPASPSAAFKPNDPAFQADPYAFYRFLRERGSIMRAPDSGYWMVCGYREVRALLRDPRIGMHAQPRPTAPSAPERHRVVRAREEAELLFSSFLHHRAPADHARLRRLIQPALSPKPVGARRARAQELADERIDAALALGRIDVVNDLGRPVALTVVSELLGIPEAIQPVCGDLARELGRELDFARTPAEKERGILAMMALAGRLRGLLAQWRENPPASDNLLWALDQARGRSGLSEEEVVAHGALLLFAGHATTQHLIGNGVLALLRNPDQWELLREHPDLIATAVGELLRYDTPVPVAPRVAIDDITIDGETIRAGEPLLLLLAAAHRDPTVFADPDRLDITRSPNPHLGFGHDAHYCIGAALGRLQAEVMIGTLVHRAPDARLAHEEVEWDDSVSIRGLRSLEILVA